MLLLKIRCKACGYTWYPNKERWEANLTAPEPDCPNPECPNYGIGVHPAKKDIWEILKTINPEAVSYE